MRSFFDLSVLTKAGGEVMRIRISGNRAVRQIFGALGS